MSNLVVWSGPNGVNIPANKKDISEIVPFANYLTEKQQNQIVVAFKAEAYDMAAEYAWKKAMVKLKETLATLGMEFIGELLQRNDINEFTPLDSVLTDFAIIQLAEQLGVIGKTAAIKLRQAQELISHYFSSDASEEFDAISAASIIRSSVQYILGEQDITVAIEFSRFRERLLGESLRIEDPQVSQIIGLPLFYIRTVCAILTSAIKNDKGATLEHALGNINLILPPIWNNLAESDKWNIGETYRDVVADGNSIAASGMKTVLSKVKGFDFVPESLRSTTYKTAARQVIEVHFAFNNFYNEPKAVKALASLGSVIPPPALFECIQAYLLVCIGNMWGISNEAYSVAAKELSQISKDRWLHYFSNSFHLDSIILNNLNHRDQVARFRKILIENNLSTFENLPRNNQLLYNAILKNEYMKVSQIASVLVNKIR
jgi:hypothetical protein